MGYDVNPNGSDLSIVTVTLQYSVFATLTLGYSRMGPTQYFLSALISKQQTPRGYLNGRRGELVVNRSSIRRE